MQLGLLVSNHFMENECLSLSSPALKRLERQSDSSIGQNIIGYPGLWEEFRDSYSIIKQ